MPVTFAQILSMPIVSEKTEALNTEKKTSVFYTMLWIMPFLLSLSACSSNNVTEGSSEKKYFDSAHLTGCFGLFDNTQGQFTIYNLAAFKDSAYLPASTFKIVNALVGVETGRISSENMVIPWDGLTRFYPAGDTAAERSL